MRIHAEQLHGHWTDWVSGHPETGFGGATPAQAISRLVEATPGLSVEDVAEDHPNCTANRLAFVVGPRCSDCDGSGRYVGLNETGVCGTCGGAGRVEGSKNRRMTISGDIFDG